MTAELVQCPTCGVERDAAAPPAVCPICADERQYVSPDGQRWIAPDRESPITLRELEPGLWGLEVAGGVGIGQLAKVIATADGCIMYDVPAAITPEAVSAVRALGPMRAIIPSHPHMFGLQSLWSAALGDAPVCVSEADLEWLGRRPTALTPWSGILNPIPGVTASQPGGHFPGSSVVHWEGGDGAGVLLAGDTIMVNPDRATVSFLRSYPNRLPLSAAVVERIAAHVARYDFDRIYSNFSLRIERDAAAAVQRSAQRHASWVRGEFDHLTGPG
ncbi:hydrolase [Microbacterium sp. KR10-403]|uniref:hydrolase n=1 Tax=Microbacterium sp. KR10-403 TaxID=3158581 RepID=UPI0032E511E9